MAWIKRMAFFLLTNILVMLSIGIITSAVNTFIYGTPNPPGNNLTHLIVFSLVWGMGGSVISLLMSKYSAKKMMGLKIITPENAQGQEQQILNDVHTLARQAQLSKMPEVAIYQSPDINAFATGPTKNNSLVAVSTGLLNKMNKDQVRGVLAHEVAHIANGDMVTLTLIQGVVNAFVLFFSRIIASAVANSLSGSDNRGGMRGSFVYMGVYIGLQMAFGVLGMIAVGYFSRQREYRADQGGAKYAGRSQMISALKALQSDISQLNPQKKDAFASFKISSKSNRGLKALMSTHPPLEMRINALERNF